VNQRRLYRSADDRILAGVAGGVAAYFDVDPVIVRIIWFLSVFFTGTLTFWAYIVMIIVVPVEPTDWTGQPTPWAPGGAPIGTTPAGYTAAYTPPPGDATPGTTESGQTPEGAGPTDPNAPVPPVPPVPPTSAPFVAGQPNQWGGDWRWQRRADRWQRRADRFEGRGSGGLMFGLLLIVVGGLLAWHQVDPNIDLGLAWPIGVVVLGVILVASSINLGKRS
jgi:phage shock protein C